MDDQISALMRQAAENRRLAEVSRQLLADDPQSNNSTVHKLVAKPKPYDGTGDAHDFLDTIKSYIDLANINPRDAFRLLVLQWTKGTAQIALRSLHQEPDMKEQLDEAETEWHDATATRRSELFEVYSTALAASCRRLTETFATDGDLAGYYYDKWQQSHQDPAETSTDYGYRQLEFIRKCETHGMVICETHRVRTFIQHAQHALRQMLQADPSGPFHDMRKVMKVARRLEAAYGIGAAESKSNSKLLKQIVESCKSSAAMNDRRAKMVDRKLDQLEAGIDEPHEQREHPRNGSLELARPYFPDDEGWDDDEAYSPYESHDDE